MNKELLLQPFSGVCRRIALSTATIGVTTDITADTGGENLDTVFENV